MSTAPETTPLPPVDPAITLLNCKQLAERLVVSLEHISAMRAAGFPMPGNRATINEVMQWRAANPNFRVTPLNSSAKRKKAVTKKK